jgi:hypothetical protein
MLAPTRLPGCARSRLGEARHEHLPLCREKAPVLLGSRGVSRLGVEGVFGDRDGGHRSGPAGVERELDATGQLLGVAIGDQSSQSSLCANPW